MIKNFTKGFISAVLPGATGFAFSFAHRSYAGNLWTLLEIKARKWTVIPRKLLKKLRPMKRAGKRPRAYTHINPFHNLDVKSDRDK